MSSWTIRWDEVPAAEVRGGALSIGNFDGVHRGHGLLLGELRRLADQVGGPAVAVTLEPHPLRLLRPDLDQPALTTAADRAALLQASGIDHVVTLQTTLALLNLRAEEFFTGVIRRGFQARGLVEGSNFGFGRGREGDVAALARFCARDGLRLVVVEPLPASDGQPVSSSRVRAALERGDVAEAATLLGRPYRIRGRVGPGQRRGQTLGFPTANLTEVETLLPANGVYAVRVHRGGQSWPGAANLGPNPTFGEQARKVEIHLIGFQGDLYGSVLEADFLARLRDTRPFADVTQLTDQLRADVDQARRIAEGRT